MQEHENKVKVYRSFNKNGKLIEGHPDQLEEENVFFVSRIPDGVPNATIATSKSKKVNTGNYTSADVFVSASVTVVQDSQEIESAFQFVDTLTLEKIEELLGQNFGNKEQS